MTRKTHLLAVLMVVVLGVMLAAPALAATKTVKLTADNKFSPASATISVGDTVNFVWDGGFHDVVFSDGKSSGTPTADAGTTYARTFSAAGTFPYICTVHESLGMKGTITVQAVASGSGGGTTTTTVPGSYPYTGPEDSALPMVGFVFIGVAGVALFKLRTREE